jgi:hypothetical protein
VGASLHEVRDTFGYTNVTMTSVYLSTTVSSLNPAFKKLESERRRES